MLRRILASISLEDRMHRIPKAGEQLTVGDCVLTVRRARQNALLQIHVRTASGKA